MHTQQQHFTSLLSGGILFPGVVLGVHFAIAIEMNGKKRWKICRQWLCVVAIYIVGKAENVHTYTLTHIHTYTYEVGNQKPKVCHTAPFALFTWS